MGGVPDPTLATDRPPECDLGWSRVTAYQGFAKRKGEDEYLSHFCPLKSSLGGSHWPSPTKKSKRTRSLVVKPKQLLGRALSKVKERVAEDVVNL